jgi:cell division protein FtsB
VPTSTSADRRAQRRLVRRVARRRRVDVVGTRTGLLTLPAVLHDRVRLVTQGDRPLVLALAGAVALAVVLLSGPAQSYLDGRERVEKLTVKAAALDVENAALEQRVADLQDPETIELLAREQQGYIRPGEVPYVLVPPEVERPTIADPRAAPEPATGPWYQRLWQELRDWVG